MADPKLNARLGLDTKEFDKGLKDAEKSTAGFGNKVGGIGKLIAAGIVGGGAIVALKTLKDVFVSTEGGADKFKATIEGSKEALGQFKRSLATLDFSTLISGLDEAFKKGKAFAELFDQLGEATAFGDIELAKLQEQSNKAWQQAQQNKGDARKKWLAEFIAVEKEYNVKAKNLAQQTYEINKAKWESINKVDADYASSVFQLHQNMFFNDMGTLKKYKAFLDGLASGVRPMEVGAGAGEVAVGKGYSKEIAEALYDYFTTFNSFADGGPQDLAKIILDLANGINSADAKLNGALRKTRDLIEVPAEVRAEAVGPIGGDFSPATKRVTGGPSGELKFSNIVKEYQSAADQITAITSGIQESFGSLGSVISSALSDGAISFSDSMNVMAAAAMAMIPILEALAIAEIISAESSKGIIGIVTAIAGIAAVIALFASYANPTAMAEGGIVYGPTNAMVGEYPGAKSNPEVVAPLDKLRSLIGGGGSNRVEIYGRLQGSDIIVSNERSLIKRNKGT